MLDDVAHYEILCRPGTDWGHLIALAYEGTFGRRGELPLTVRDRGDPNQLWFYITVLIGNTHVDPSDPTFLVLVGKELTQGRPVNLVVPNRPTNPPVNPRLKIRFS